MLSTGSNAVKEKFRLKNMLRTPLTITLVIAIVGIMVLEQIVRIQEPPRVSLDQLERYEGRTVLVEGILTDTYPTGSGAWQLELTQHQAQVQIYAPTLDFTPLKGDRVEATGEVELYHNRWEINCQSGQVRLLKAASKGDLTLADLALAPVAYSGVSLTLSGVVGGSVIMASEGAVYFDIQDVDGVYSMNVTIAPSLVGATPRLEVGGQVVLKGVLEYNTYQFEYRLIVNKEGHGVWLKGR